MNSLSLVFLFHLVLNEEVLLIDSEHFEWLLHKMYYFTPKFNRTLDPRYKGLDWPDQDATIVFTKYDKPKEQKPAVIGGGGLNQQKQRKTQIRISHDDQYCHTFDREDPRDPVEDIVPVFRGIDELPDHNLIFCTRDYYDQAVEYRSYLTKRHAENRKAAL